MMDNGILELETILKTIGIPLARAEDAVDIFKISVAEAFGDTHLPALYEVLGRDNFLKVLDIFQGTEMISCSECGEVLEWPARDELAAILADVIIFIRVKNAKLGQKSRTIRELADELDLSTGMVRRAFNQMDSKSRHHASMKRFLK